MITTKTVSSAVCDGCGRERLGTAERPPAGYHAVIDYYPHQGDVPDHGATFYACRQRCITRAAWNALAEAETEGLPPKLGAFAADIPTLRDSTADEATTMDSRGMLT